MANRTTDNHRNSNGVDKTSTGISYIPDGLSTRGPQIKNKLSVDDVIVSLANAYENRRARQATEWERMRQQNFLRSL